MRVSDASLPNQSRALVEQSACFVSQPYHVQQLDAQLACSALTALSSLFLGSRRSFQSLPVCTGLLLQPRQLLCQTLHLCLLLVGSSLQVLDQWEGRNQTLQLQIDCLCFPFEEQLGNTDNSDPNCSGLGDKSTQLNLPIT